MNCKKCGKVVPDNNLFCGYCGAPIEIIKPRSSHQTQNRKKELYDWACHEMDGPDSEIALEVLAKLAEEGYYDALCDIYNYYAEIDLGSEETFYYIKLLYKFRPDIFDATMLGTLAYSYYCNIQTREDAKITMHYCLEAYKLGNDMTPFLIGEMYYHRIGVPHDLNKAAEWFEISAKINPTFYEGVARWGYFVYHGIGGVKKNKSKGRQLWIEAAKNGNETAKGYLKEYPETIWDKMMY